MTLAETYSAAAGVPLAEPDMPDAFYPLDHPVDRAILIHAFAGATVQQGGGLVATFPAKIYDHFAEVIALLRPLTDAAGYRLYQIGAPNEPVLAGVESLVGKTTLHQCAYLVKNAALLIGNDSIWAHYRGAAGGAQCHIYGSTSKPHQPFWRNPAKCVLIESHRGGKRPTYASVENPKTINWIPPEAIARAAVKLLGLPATITRQSLYFGEAYHTQAIELVPNIVVNPQVQIPGALVIRMDYVDTTDSAAVTLAENALLGNVQLRKCLIVTDRELNLNHLAQLKPNIAAIRVEVDKVGADWIKALKRLGMQTAFFSSERDPDALARRRLDLYDACLFDHYVPATKEDFLKGAKAYLNREPEAELVTPERLRFSTQKFILSADKVYLSEAHWRAGRHTPGTAQNTDAIIDSPHFWADISHFALFLE
jgi:hypothetical protein